MIGQRKENKCASKENSGNETPERVLATYEIKKCIAKLQCHEATGRGSCERIYENKLGEVYDRRHANAI